VFWSLLYLLFGMLMGIYTESTRAVRSQSLGVGSGEAGAPIMAGAVIVGSVVAAALVVTSWLWVPRLLAGSAVTLTVVLVVAVLLFSGHSALAGGLSGRGDWGRYAGLVSGDAVVRLAVIVGAAALGAGLFGLEAAVVSGSLVWLGMLAVSTPARAAARSRADVPLGRLVRNSAQACLAALASAALVVGFPVLLRATSNDVEWATSAPVVLAISLTRAPLLIPLTAYQGVAVTYFLVNRRNGFAPALRLAGAVTAVGVAGALLAAIVGPALLQLLFGASYRLDARTFAGLTIAATVMALLTLSGSAVLALGMHREYAVGWVLATVVSILLLLLPLPLADRAVVSLVLGPLVGLAYHGRALVRPA